MPTRWRSAFARKAGLLGLLFAGAVALMLACAIIGLDTVSAVRAFVAGESRWSKAQKEAVDHLRRYAATGEPYHYAAYRETILVPLGDRVAREELERPAPDLDRVYAGFIQGENHPDDVARMARFFRRFREISYVDSAAGIWARGDSLIAELRERADALDAAVAAGGGAPVNVLLAEIERLDRELLPLEYAFSEVLGEGARWARGLVIRVLLVVGALVIVAGLVIIAIILRRIRRSEEAVRASELRYRTLVEDATYGIGRSTPDGRILSANPAMVEMLGYDSEAELQEQSLREVYDQPEDRDRVLAEFAASERVRGVETRWRKQDGEVIDVRLSGRTRHAPDGAVRSYEIIAEDVTDQKRLEDQVRQSQKMEAVGQLTGGIAHDLNNLLTAILANADLVAAELRPDQGDARTDIAELQGAARRGAQMIRKLLAFSRQERLQPAPHDLNALVGELAGVLGRLLPEHIAVRIETERGLPSVSVDPGAVEQMLVNLATNARDAMPEGGTLTIRTRATPVGRSSWPDHHEHPGRFVCITVADDGTGMSPETRKRAFEPFFTTKPVGAGTGLGLAMVYGLMKQHDGFARIDSVPRGGTTVSLCFPVFEADLPAPTGEPHAGPAAHGGGETLLLVEDEDIVRRAAARVLERLGYTVLTARNGVEGLEVVERRHRDLDLVISDIVMPVMGGRRLYDEIRARGLSVRFLFMSGYTERDTGEGEGLVPGVPYLEKPWTPATLAARIREVLDRPLEG